jgi:hypothetical protein
MNPTPKWATVNDTNSVLASTKRMVQTKQIDPERLHVTRVSDANQDCYSNVFIID